MQWLLEIAEELSHPLAEIQYSNLQSMPYVNEKLQCPLPFGLPLPTVPQHFRLHPSYQHYTS